MNESSNKSKKTSRTITVTLLSSYHLFCQNQSWSSKSLKTPCLHGNIRRARSIPSSNLLLGLGANAGPAHNPGFFSPSRPSQFASGSAFGLNLFPTYVCNIVSAINYKRSRRRDHVRAATIKGTSHGSW